MSHEIEIVNGVAQMAYAGEVPWHGLGKQVPSDLTPNQMMEAAGLDWTVSKEDMFINGPEGPEKVEEKQALVRSWDRKQLDVVGKGWEPVQNETAFEFFYDYCMNGNMDMHTAGSLKGGQIVWALAKVKDGFTLFNGDEVESYLLFTNPHRFGQSIDVRFTPIRTVCKNTLALALRKSENYVKLNHKKVFNAEEVKETLGIAHVRLTEYKEIAEFLGSKSYKKDLVQEYFGHLFPAMSSKGKEESRNAKRAFELLEEQPGAQYAEGSWWQAFNAVTYMTDHELGRNADTRLQSAWFGANKGLKIKALEKAVEYAEAA